MLTTLTDLEISDKAYGNLYYCGVTDGPTLPL